MSTKKSNDKPSGFPRQSQKLPGKEYKMTPQPEIIKKNYLGSGKLFDKTAVITGGDSGIGRAIAVHFAKEGADCIIIYLNEREDAKKTKELVENEGRRCLLVEGDISNKNFSKSAVEEAKSEFGKLNILVNNAGVQFPADNLREIDLELMEKTFRTNIFSMFYLTKEVLQYLNEGDCIINTTSVTAFRGSEHLIDYSSTKGAINAFTRSLAINLAERKIRVNGVAPGPIWTPLIVSTFDDVSKFGQKTPLGRAGQPSEVAPAYVFLASDDASYITGQIIHINGGVYTS
ncbi:MAG: glucose 1-dehydrogenase [Ignavibacteriales bacterium]|nr:MAG: glucose 1-dehydrogenase [Ignavibacteriales bacterium]